MATSAEAVEEPDEHAEAGPDGEKAPSVVAGMVRLARPQQWIKNLLVFVAPGVAGILHEGGILWRAAAVFGIFCLAASGTYFLNDSIDAEADRRHPRKRARPVAAGNVSEQAALVTGIALLAASITLGSLLGWHTAVIVCVYGAINLAYSLELKNEPILDLVAVSSGFLLRAIAGGVATGVPLSNWFLIVAAFGSLLIVTGKRSGEQKLLSANHTDHAEVRQTLGQYTPSFLQAVRTLSAAVTVAAYCLWAFERATQVHPGHDPIWFQLTIVPFVIGLLHVLRLLDSGVGDSPEDLALYDHRIQLYGVTWVGLFVVGIYG